MVAWGSGDDGHVRVSQLDSGKSKGYAGQDAGRRANGTVNSPEQGAQEGARSVADVFVWPTCRSNRVLESPPPLHLILCCVDVVKGIPFLWRLIASVALQPYSDATPSWMLVIAAQMLLQFGATAFVLAAPRPLQRQRGLVVVVLDVLWLVLLACHTCTPLGYAGSVRAMMDAMKIGEYSESVVWTSAAFWLITVRTSLLQLPPPWLLLDVLLWVIGFGAGSLHALPDWLWRGAGQWDAPGWLVLLLAAMAALTIDAWMERTHSRCSMRTENTFVSAVSCQASTTKLTADIASHANPVDPEGSNKYGAEFSKHAGKESNITEAWQGKFEMSRGAGGADSTAGWQSAAHAHVPTPSGICTSQAMGTGPTAPPPERTEGSGLLAVKSLKGETSVPSVPESTFSPSPPSVAALHTPGQVLGAAALIPTGLRSEGGAVTLLSSSPASPVCSPMVVRPLSEQLLDLEPPPADLLPWKWMLEELVDLWLETDVANSRASPDHLLYTSELQHYIFGAKVVGPPGMEEDVLLLQAGLKDSVRAVLEAEGVKAAIGPAVSYKA